jgi:hypothetical protein
MNTVLTVETSGYLAACHLEELRGPARRKLSFWIPSKEDGDDLLVTHGKEKRDVYPIYLWITHDNRYLETRGLGKPKKIEMVNFPSKTPKARDARAVAAEELNVKSPYSFTT